jgi:putative Ca2+/H+ antiporter (TMEM165/GDT1 family)
MNWQLFLSVFSIIFIAELPDKTAFATLLMATRGRPMAIFLGVAAAFVVQSLVAVAFGSLIGLLPARWVHLAAGLLFIGFAWHTWSQQEEESSKEEAVKEPETVMFFRAAWKAFVVIFIAEWGDLTQIATASLAARYHESVWTVFFSAILALWAVTALAVFVGHRVKHVIHTEILKKVSTLVFVLVGIYFITSWFWT